MEPLTQSAARRIKLPKCPYCGRRPELRAVPGRTAKVKTPDGEEVDSQVFERLPCCSARVIKESGVGKKERLRNLDVRQKMKGE